MDVRTAEELLEEILEGYNKKPTGWQIALDHLGNSVFIGPSRAYVIKRMMISPQESLGVGLRLENAEPLRAALGQTAPSGFRPLGKDLAQRVLTELSTEGREGQREDLISKILKIEPVPTWDLERDGIGGIVGGPYMTHPDLRLISKSQSELDLRLNRELQNLFMARYPMRASMFR